MDPELAECLRFILNDNAEWETDIFRKKFARTEYDLVNLTKDDYESMKHLCGGYGAMATAGTINGLKYFMKELYPRFWNPSADGRESWADGWQRNEARKRFRPEVIAVLDRRNHFECQCVIDSDSDSE